MKAGKENMLGEIMNYYSQAVLLQELYYTFDKKGQRESGVKRVYKENGEAQNYMLKFVYE